MKKSHLIIFAASFGLILASIGMSLYFWNQLPASLPTHFGITGAPDAWTEKSILTVFMVPALHLALLALFAVLYRHPQYSSWPTTLILMTVEEKKRNKVYEVLRGMLVSTTALISILFAYLQFAILATANGRLAGLYAPAMFIFLGLMVIYLGYYNIKMLITIRRLVKK